VSTRASRLDTVLRVRRIQEDQRKGDLARAAAAEAEAARLVAEAEERLRATSRTPGGVLVQAFLADRGLVAARARQVSTATNEHALAEGETDRSRALLTEARTRTSGLERLVERGLEERRQVLLAVDQAVAEESTRARGVTR